MKILYVGNFTQEHCTEVHIAATLEDMGHEVTRLQEDSKFRNSLTQRAVGHDMFLFTRTWSNLVTLDHLKKLKEMGIPTVSYHLDLYVGLQREAGLDNDPFWKTEYVFSPDGDPKSQEVFESKGINHFYLKPGVFKKECISLPENDDESLSGDVVFVGGGAEYGHKEWPYRHQLVKWLEETYDEGYKKYGHPQRTVRNMELNQLYANAKIVVGDTLCLNFNHPNYWSDRVYETIGRGGFMIHPYIVGMEEEFTDGKDIVFYEYGNFEELKEKIDYYLANPKKREKIRKAGQKLIIQKATYHNRLQQVLNTVFSSGSNPEVMWGEKTLKQASVDGDVVIHDVTIESDNVYPPIKINLGAGSRPTEGFVNVDHIDLEGIDKVHNLMEFPYPFEDGVADEIHAVDVVEHLDNYTDDKRPSVVAFVEEAWRILQPGGVLYMQMPGWKADFLWIDPTHVRGFDIQSFDFFDPTKPFGKSTGFYSKCKFSVKAEELKNHNLRFWLTKI